VAVLISKPGITSTVGGGNATPKAWSQAWFRGFISDYLKGADVRNAVGSNGITISGTLTSPFATIGLGSPLTFTGNVLIKATGAIQFEGSGSSTPILQINGTTVPTIQGYGPTAGALVDMTPDTGTVTLTQTGGTTAPTSSATWSKQGNQVMMVISAFAAMTSNSTALTFTGLPAEIQPNRLCYMNVGLNTCIDGGTQQLNTVSASVTAASGTITLYKNGSSTGWTNTATQKGFNNLAIILQWMLN
jgi:hypothetical protein